jgi:integrase
MKYKLYAKQVRGQEGFVYLYIHHNITGSRQPKLTSLGIKIPESCCSTSRQDFKKVVGLSKDYLLRLGYDSIKDLNSFLEERLNTYIKANGQINFVSEEKKTLNLWFEILINRQSNQGTKMRYKNVFNLLVQFQKWYSVNKKRQVENEIILMREINVDFLIEFRNWLRTEPGVNEKRKKNRINSSNFKLKCIKSVLNKSHKENFYAFQINPFDHINFHFQEQNVEILTLEELKQIIEVELVEVYRRTIPLKDGTSLWGKDIKEGVEERNKRNKRYKSKHSLNDIRNYFLFQLLSQGIRVSDMVTLRWNNFQYSNDTLRISKVMVKTRKSINILVNEKMTSIISHYIIRYNDFYPDEVKEIINVNESIISKYNLYSRKSSLIKLTDENWRHFYHIIDETSKYSTTKHKGLLIDFETITKLQDFLIERHKDGTLHQYLNDGIPYTKKRVPIGLSQIGKLIGSLNKWHSDNLEENERTFTETYKKLKETRNHLVIELIRKINSNEEIKKDFVFPLLSNSDFREIEDEDFSVLSEYQYRKFQSVRSYYNKLLKLIAVQSNLNKRLTSHLARHSYTSLMLELGEDVNLYDLMTSLGHKHLSTTQTYIQRLSNKKIDKLNLVISDKLNTGLSINI